jgi:ABC-2 type transport system ATP-binding protein
MPNPTSTSPWAIDLTGVSKIYSGKIRALDNIAMQVGKGEIFGFLGPNGAGKSTLVKILTTVIRPTAAQGSVLGNPIGHKPTLGRIGYLPEHHRFPEYLTGRQVVEYFGALSGTPAAQCKRRADELLDFVGMRAWANQRVSKYSKGMRQRVGIAQALVSDPELVILDEPTDGVDPTGRRDIRDMIQTLKTRGTTVFINSHLLSELELVADRVSILVKGRVAAQGTINDLTKHRQRYDLDIAASPAEIETAARSVLSAIPGATLAESSITIPGSDPATVQPLIDALRRAGLTIRAVRPYRPSLEDLFMEAVIDQNTGKAFAPGASTTKEAARP